MIFYGFMSDSCTLRNKIKGGKLILSSLFIIRNYYVLTHFSIYFLLNPRSFISVIIFFVESGNSAFIIHEK